jgi:hypothetical protein
VMLEAVDARHRPVPPGQLSHTTLLTNLANHVQPLIRFDIGDRIVLPGTGCPCGSALPVVQVQGRRDDTLVVRGRSGQPVTLLPLALTTVLEEEAGAFDFQLRQTAPDALRLSLGPTAARSAHARAGCISAPPCWRVCRWGAAASSSASWRGQVAAEGSVHDLMKAVVYTRYGSPEVLEIRQVAKPEPQAGEVLVRVHATTVSQTDCGMLRPRPWFVRFFAGLLRPRRTVLGMDFAGVVEALGAGVTSFKPQDPGLWRVGRHRHGAASACAS